MLRSPNEQQRAHGHAGMALRKAQSAWMAAFVFDLLAPSPQIAPKHPARWGISVGPQSLCQLPGSGV